ncbi:MAG: dTMP kinase [Planctomycetes bacterium]|nr:dTMP kinase [Planctomycetota bacterium]
MENLNGEQAPSPGASNSARGGQSGGRFFVLDGMDGCGKTTQSKLLVKRLEAETGREVLHLREPGSTPVGESLRALLLDSKVHLLPEVEALLFLAARRTLLHDLVEPALAAGKHVVCERFHASTFAYQGVAGGLGGERVLALCHSQIEGPYPDLELILGLQLEQAMERRGAGTDRIENQGDAYHQRVALGYEEYVGREPRARWVHADASMEEVAGAVWKEVQVAL